MPGAFSSKRNFLFDLDGTLIDSTPVHARAYVAALTPKHPALARSFDYGPFGGRPTRQVFYDLGLRDEAELTQLTRYKQEHYLTSLAQGAVEIFPWTIALLSQLERQGRRLFLVTGASRVSTERVLEATKLSDFFEGITVAEDVRTGKPGPEPYLYTVTHYGLEKKECLAIEDSPSGLKSAQSAGVDVVSVHTDLELPGVTNVHNFAHFSQLLSE